MTTEIISDINFFDPDNLIPFVELDDAIIRNLTLGLLDFGNIDTVAVSGPVPLGTSFTSLTNDRASAVSATLLGTISNGMLPFPQTVTGPKLNLPASFKLPASTKRFLSILWLKAPQTGWAASGSSYSLGGVLNNTTTTAQWGYTMTNSSGTLGNFAVVFPISGTSAGSLPLSGAALSGTFDGNLHQLAFEWAVNTSNNTYSVTVYRDGVIIGSSTGAFTAATINVPAASTPSLGQASGSFVGTYAPNVSLGRPSLWNLTGKTNSIASILQADRDAANGFLS